MRQIVDLELSKLILRIEKLGYQVKISNKAKEFIAEKGYDQKYGARPLNRAIQKYIEDLIAENVVSNTIKDGDSISIDTDKDNKEELQLKIEKVPAV